MTRRLVRILAALAAGLGLAWLVDRWLGGRRLGGPGSGRDGRGSESDQRLEPAAPPNPVRSTIEIGAPIERVWLRLAEVERQPEWMVDLKWVRVETPGPIRVGSRASALVRIMGIGVADPVEVISFVPPHEYAIRHDGHFQGSGVFHLEALEGNGGRTRVTWDETLIPPILPNLLGLILAPILGRVFRADLERLRDQLEIEMVTVGR